MNVFVLLAALVLLRISPSTDRMDECPMTCPAFPTVQEFGTPPPGVTIAWGVEPGSLKDGDAVTGCATCTTCRENAILLAVDVNSTGNYCFTIDFGGGASQPQPKISRYGQFAANCDGQTCMNIVVTTCNNPVTPLGYNKLICMYCGCE